jgi:hypothetical protein
MLMCVCVCAFSLRQESPDMILGDEPLISEMVLSQLLSRGFCYVQGNQMVWFSILGYPVFLPVSSPILQLTDAPLMVVMSVIASVAKTTSRP